MLQKYIKKNLLNSLKLNYRYNTIYTSIKYYNRHLDIEEDVDLSRSTSNAFNKVTKEEALAPGIADKSHAYRVSANHEDVSFSNENDDLINTPYFKPISHGKGIQLKSMASAISNEMSDSLNINSEAAKIASTETKEDNNMAKEAGELANKTRVISSGHGKVSVNEN
ncbi:hypothetical protein K502DRAFT_350243 [Neoconidiobolus thromboides FSU 785]|nr:hypothetical protein K502DRAFT_350243 [Neoconidiobolus thromboides FSU 785]